MPGVWCCRSRDWLGVLHDVLCEVYRGRGRGNGGKHGTSESDANADADADADATRITAGLSDEVGLGDVDEETRESWAVFFNDIVESATPDSVTEQHVKTTGA